MLHVAKESFVGEIDGVTYSFTAGKSIVDGSKPQQGKLLKLWGHLFEPLVSSFDHLEKPEPAKVEPAKEPIAKGPEKPVAEKP